MLAEVRNLIYPGKHHESAHNGFEQRVVVQSVGLDASGAEHQIVVLRDRARPACLFGWRAPVSWSDDPASTEDPELVATNIWANLEEDILATGLGFPKNCMPDAVAWF